MGEDRVLFQAGRKTFEVIAKQGKNCIEFQWPERYRGRTHANVVSFWELVWVCDWLLKASKFRVSSGERGKNDGAKFCLPRRRTVLGSSSKLVLWGEEVPG